MKLSQLETFVAVIENGGVRAAARAMHRSQAAVTKALRSLEEEAGLSLVRRNAKGVVLTPAGDGLYARAVLIRNQIRLASEELRLSAHREAGEVRAGLTPIVTLLALPPAHKRFRQRFPGTRLVLTDGFMSRLVPLVRDGSLDFAVVAENGGLPRKEFLAPCIGVMEMTLAVRCDHPILKTPVASTLGDCEWAWSSPIGMEARTAIENLLKGSGATVPSVINITDPPTTISLLEDSDVIGLLPVCAREAFARHRLAPLRVPGVEPPRLELRLVRKPDAPLTEPAAYFARCLEGAIKAFIAP